MESLGERRDILCLNFALKCLSNPKFKNLFIKSPDYDYSVRKQRKFQEPQCAKARYQNSPLVYLTKILNQYFDGLPAAR